MPALARWPRSAFVILRSATGSHASWTASYPSASGVRTATTGHGPASITVTGVTPPLSSSKSCVMPSFFPTRPFISELDLDVDAGRKVEPHERVDRLRGRRVDVDQALVRAHLEVLPRVLVLERTADHAVDILLGRQRHGTGDGGAGALGRVNDVARRLVHLLVVIALQPDSDLLLWHRRLLSLSRGSLLRDRGDDAGTDGAAALTDREAQSLIHGDRLDQLDLHVRVVARHDHLLALRQLDRPRHVGR